MTTLQDITDAIQAFAAEQVAAAKSSMQQSYDTLRAASDGQAATIADLKARITALTPPPAPVPTWSDDFATLDRTRWNVRQEAEGGTRQGYCLPANVTVQPDGLHISVRRQSGLPSGKLYSTGYIDTVGRFSALVGRWEIVAKLPTARGLWPAIWLRCDASAGEIDIMEAVGGLPGTVVQTVHQDTSGTGDRSGYEAKPAGFNPALFHEYAVERDADGTVRWYIDKALTRTVRPGDLSTKLKQPVTWLAAPAYSSPLNLRINVQCGGGMPDYYGKPIDASSVLPDDMVIRSVRYFRGAA